MIGGIYSYIYKVLIDKFPNNVVILKRILYLFVKLPHFRLAAEWIREHVDCPFPNRSW